MKIFTKITNLCLILVLLIILLEATNLSAGDQKDKELERFLALKEFIYKSNWEGAKQGFEKFSDDFPGSKYKDETGYWFSYSMNKLANGQKDPYKIIEHKEEAVKGLSRLIRLYPDSVWLDDAQALRVEICGDLVVMGKDEYKKYIDEAKNSNESELRMLGLDTLMKVDRESAIPILKKTVKTDKSPKIRKKGVFLLGKYFTREALTILEEVAKKDTDNDVRKEAGYWLAQMKSHLSPTKLNYFVFSARLTDQLQLKRIPENKLTTFFLPGKANLTEIISSITYLFSKKSELKAKINTFFNNKLSWLGQYAYKKGLTEYDLAMTAHKFNGFYIRIPSREIRRKANRITGKVIFHNLKKDKKYYTQFSLDTENEKAVGIRNGDRISIIVLQAVLGDIADIIAAKKMYDEKRIKNFSNAEIEQMKKNIYISPEFLESYSMSKVFNGKGYQIFTEGQGLIINFIESKFTFSGKSRAEINSPDGKWQLEGHLILYGKERKIMAKNSSLVNPKGETVVRGKDFLLPLDKPEKYQIIGEGSK